TLASRPLANPYLILQMLSMAQKEYREVFLSLCKTSCKTIIVLNSKIVLSPKMQHREGYIPRQPGNFFSVHPCAFGQN
ncbi:MAG: hypothetical protein ACUVSL_10785, partial [Chloroflexus sp.]|uniref:hypothetical protein n=1 Tax=Chloroflexus sp. TaxID=1904827 RepID=UPI004049A86E